VAEELNIRSLPSAPHRARLLEKLGLGNTAELIRYGLEHGLVE
jgi:DNA-binding CsgD family transcriptional regulator